MRFKALVGLLLVVAASTSFGSASQAGAIFLLIFPGARPNGMGASFCSIADDVVKPVEGLGNIGFSFIYLTTGETEGTDPYGASIARWRTFDFSIGVTYSTLLRQNLAVGGGIKFIYSYLAPSWLVTQLYNTRGGGQGSSFAVDLSLLYMLTDRINVGAVLQNLGPNIRYIQGGVSDPLPRSLKAGVSYKLLNSRTNRLTLATEFTKVLVALTDPLDLNYEAKEAWKHFGIEYWYRDFFSARAGYFLDWEGHRTGPTFGGGVKFKGFQFDIGVDSELYEFDTENYRFSLTYTF